MKKTIIATILLSSLVAAPAMAKSAKDIGTIFAQIDMCKLEGRINMPEKKIMRLKVADKYNVAKRTKAFKRRVTNGQFKEFDRMKKQGGLGKAIKCGVLKDKWLG
ncbi:hypothetical protein L4D76_25445 [Photobacterium sagamiensis]|uniref:hypothetical protein n=1 Tax=Photobacterium TaxID=657 RepID=UPI003001D1B6